MWKGRSMAKERIVIIEDNIDLSNVMKDFLENDGFEVIQVFDGIQGIACIEEKSPELVILDLMLPGVDGINICKKIREERQIPIIIISAKNSDYDKVLALGVGADDYMTKPFSQIELVARVKSHLRRATIFSSSKSKSQLKKCFDDLVIDTSSYGVMIRGEEVEFSPKEFQLLDFLTNHPKQVFSKEQLIEQVWGYSEFIDDNTIAVYIGRIREKLTPEYASSIKTVWGVGYRWER